MVASLMLVAEASPVSAAGDQIILPFSGTVTVTGWKDNPNAIYNSYLSVVEPDEVAVCSPCTTSLSSVSLGHLAEDTEIVLRLYVANTGRTMYSNGPSATPGPGATVTQMTPTSWIVAFEDGVGPPVDVLVTVSLDSSSYAWDITSWFGSRPSGGYFADPVGTAYGNFFDSMVDLPAQAGLYGLGAERSYNSQDESVGPLGRGWRGTFSETAIEDSGDVRLTLGSGRQIIFEADGLGGWNHPVEFGGALSEELDGSYRVTMTDGEIWDFDLDGRLEAKARWDGQSVTVSRDVAGLPVLATSSEGPTLTFSYSGGRLVEIEATDGRTVEYDYDLDQNLAVFTDVAGADTYYVNDLDGLVDTITNSVGVVLVDNTYNGEGQVVEQSTPESTTTFVYDVPSRLTTVTTVETGESLLFLHDEFGRLIRVTDPDGKFIEQEYDASGWMSSGISRLGGETVTSLDSTGNPLSVIDESGVESEFSYDVQNRIETVTNPRIGTTTFAYTGDERLPSTITDSEMNIATQTVADGLVSDVTDPDGVTLEYRYNGLRQLIEAEDEYGNITAYEYDAAGRPNAIEAPSGDRTTTIYDDAGRPTLVTAADDGETTTVYDTAGRVTSVEDPTGAVTSYTYDPVTGLVASMTNPRLKTTLYTYDSAGRLERTTFHDTTYTETDYGILSRVIAERDELARESNFDHDDDGNITSVEDPAGGTTETTFDTAGRVETTTDPGGVITTNDYDPVTGQLLTESSSRGTVAYTYDDLGRPETVTDLRGGVTTTAYTDAGRVETVTDPVGLVTTNNYDNAGRLGSVTAPGNLTTTYGYDVNSRVVTVTSPEGNLTTTTYDPTGRVATVTDPAGVVTTNTWSKRGELRTRTVSGAGTEEFFYFPDGTLEWVDDALDNRTTFGYDDRGRQTTRTDPNGQTWSTAYNDAGEVVSETDPLNRTTSYSYDPAGRLATTSDPSGRTIANTWNPDGQIASWAATDGTNTQAAAFTYDSRGYRDTATLDGRTWWYTHNDAGDLSRVEHPDYRDLWFDYDAAGRRTRLTRPDGTSYYINYDPTGRLDSLRPVYEFTDTFIGWNGPLDSNKWTATAATGGDVELVDHAAVLSVPATPSETSSIEAKTASVMDSSSTFTYEFASDATPATMKIYERYSSDDDHYRLAITSNSTTARIFKAVAGVDTELATFAVPVDTDKHNVRFEINGDQVCAVVWGLGTSQPAWDSCVTNTAVTGAGVPRVELNGASGSGNSVTLDGFSNWNPAGPAHLAVGYTWDDDGNLTGEALAGGGNRAWTWDDGQLVQLDQTGIPGANHTTGLTYDAAGRIATEAKGGITTTYGYDLANQLRTATPTSGPASSWDYDDLGRRTEQAIGSNTTTYAYDHAGQLTTSTPTSGPATIHAYDGAGRRTSDTTGTDVTTFTYNPSGQLAALALPGGDTQLRAYNPDDALDTIANSSGGDVDTYQLDWDTTNGLAELLGFNHQRTSGGVTTNASTGTVRGPGAPWALSQQGATPIDLAVDIHGSPITSSANTLAQDSTYTEWGEPDRTPTLPVKLGYRGELATSDLLHLRARDYQTGTGQFTTVDPLDGFDGTPVRNSPYHYADNDPLNSSDPTGLATNDSSGIFDTRFGWAVPLPLAVAGGTTGFSSTAFSLGAAIALGEVAGVVIVVAGVGLFFYAASHVCCSGSANHGVTYPQNTATPYGGPADTLTLLGQGNRENPSTIGIAGPAVETENPTECPLPPGSTGSHSALLRANRGSQCQAHHIVQHAAVRDVGGSYSYGSAQAIVLTISQHLRATAVQRTSRVGGTLGIELQVAADSLEATRLPDLVVRAALRRARSYFEVDLGLSMSTRTRIPCPRPGCR